MKNGKRYAWVCYLIYLNGFIWHNILSFQEEPGESLSDCDKEDEDESLEEGSLIVDDEDDSEDSFFVPDGYLSENEVVL